MKREEKWFPEKLRKCSVRPIFVMYLPYHYRELPLPSSGGLPSTIALPGGAVSPKLCIEIRGVGADLKKKFPANNEQGSMKRGEKWYPENSEKMLA